MKLTSSEADRVLVAACSIMDTGAATSPSHVPQTKVPSEPSCHRRQASLDETSYDVGRFLAEASLQQGTVLYLAYGSNLSNEKFRGARGIKPLSQINVQVPSLRLTFDLPGLPYSEPCFANSALRDPNNGPPKEDQQQTSNEKTALLSQRTQKRGYRKDQWHKGLIGVVYEVTPSDYAHIIATEGGGSGYQDILVDCHPFADSDPTLPVPQNPTTPPFKAHTLFAPTVPPGEEPPKDGGSFQRPNPSYAQASARYLKFFTDGGEQLGLPYEYREYLSSLRPYTVTTNKQRLGQFVFLSTWLPFVVLVFAMGKMFADKDGKIPRWLGDLTKAIFRAVWASYDGFFKELFGDGERTIGDLKDAVTDDRAVQEEIAVHAKLTVDGVAGIHVEKTHDAVA